MAERADVVVIGGGVIGVCSAWFLAERGARVTLLERGEIASGCSYGNAGWIFPSHVTPLPAPGVIRRALRWLLDAESPFYVKPRLELELVRWLWGFRGACSAERMRRTFELRRELGLRSLALYEKLAALPELDCGLTQRGLVFACASSEMLEDARAELALLRSLGGEGRELSARELPELVPGLAPDLVGGVYYPTDAHIRPADFVVGLAQAAAARGVRICSNTEVIALERLGGNRTRVVAGRGEFECRDVVLAAGAWSPGLARPLGLRLPLQPAKGYSLTYRRPPGLGDVAAMLGDSKVCFTPMRDVVRFAGTLELAGLDLSINFRRVGAIRRAARRYFPGLGELERVETWRGLRPVTPDDLAVIGRPRAAPNVVIAGGHGMCGIAQGPITGRLVADLVSGETPELDLAPFSPDRFSGGRG